MASTQGPDPQPVEDRPPPPRRHLPVGSVILVAVGAVVVLASLALAAGGGVLVWAHATQRDADGYYTTPTERLETTSYAITSDRIDLGSADDKGPIELGDLATVRIRATQEGDGAVFVGIASQRDVDAYLAEVSHAQIDDIDLDPFSVSYRYLPGTEPPARPESLDIWVSEASGRGTQTLQWSPSSGQWVVVIMNADATSGVTVDVSAGAKATWVLGVGIGLLVGGLVILALGAVLLVLGVIGLSRAGHVELAGPPPTPGRPVRLEGRLDQPLSRWLWLVKWVLLIPHLIVLFFLWIAFAVVTVVAFFAVLFTARYPRSLFDFNVGVLRWTWRVTYYGYSALGTDRYPPFTLGHAPDYPATLEVAYPERLSRGLVLVKWWLLAIPHYLVLALIWGGATASAGEAGLAASIGLVGLLVLFAAIALLFTGRYPNGMFDLVMGLNRWGYRVVAYVTLLRDDYPPFRLDQGGTEPPGEPSATLGGGSEP